MVIDNSAFDAVMAAKASVYWAATSAVAAWIIGLIGLALNAGGLVFLWRQLQSNGAALKTAAEAVMLTAADTRPWIEVSIHGMPQLTLVKDSNRTYADLGFTIRATNVGRTPALSTQFWAKVIPANTMDALESILQPAKAELLPGRAIFPDRSLDQPYAHYIAPELVDSEIHLLIGASYFLPDGRTPAMTPLVVVITQGSSLTPGGLARLSPGRYEYETSVRQHQLQHIHPV